MSVVSRVPLGWVTVLAEVWVDALWAGAPSCRREMLASVSSKAVVVRLLGLEQPGVGCTVVTKLQ